MQIPQPKLSQQEIAQAWAKITIIRWRTKMRNLKVQSSGELYRSFVFNVVSSAQGDLTKIEFAFNYYGKFVDMGVGKGTRIGDRPVSRTSRVLGDRMLGSPRRAKKWYSKTFYAEVMRLFEILKEAYGRKGQLLISENINDSSIK